MVHADSLALVIDRSRTVRHGCFPLALALLLGGCAGQAAPRREALAASPAGAGVIQPQPPPGSCHARGSGLFSLPDARCTPGAVDRAVRQANIEATICSPGWTRNVRPPESVTEPEKRASLAAYGDRGRLRDYEYDHLIPLGLGGAANNPGNLWPEPGASPNPKDDLEHRLGSMVCAGRLSLAAARREIASDWVAVYRRLRR